jgi:hypothetical protein
VFVLQLLSFWYSKAKFNVSSPCYSFSFTIFLGFNDDIVIVLQPSTLLQASSTTCFKWVPPYHFAFVEVFFYCFIKPKPLMKNVKYNTFIFQQTIISKNNG